MSNSSAASNINNALIWIDRACDYVPVVSTITNLVDIFEKCAFSGCCSSKSINSNRYFSHVNDKSSLRCVVLLVPILGNIIVGINDLIQNQKNEKIERECQDFQAGQLGLEVSLLPQNILERRQIIETKQQEKLQEDANICIEGLKMQIVGMTNAIGQFRKYIDNPEEPLEIGSLFSVKFFSGTHSEKIDYLWSQIKRVHMCLDIGSTALRRSGLDQKEAIIQKQQELSELKQELLKLRQTSYRCYISTIGKEDLLQESKKYYLQSLCRERYLTDREKLNVSEEQMTLDSILPKLKERVLTESKNDYAIVEIQEIISQIEKV
jgi:hypothetical protein